jgi:hypothetical protein
MQRPKKPNPALAQPLPIHPAAGGAVLPPTPSTTPQRHGDRSSGDAEDAAALSQLPHYVRFNDLYAAGIVNNRTHLGRLIEDEGFPPGRLLSPNARAWLVSEILPWLADRPVERKKVTITDRHVSKRHRDRNQHTEVA